MTPRQASVCVRVAPVDSRFWLGEGVVYFWWTCMTKVKLISFSFMAKEREVGREARVVRADLCGPFVIRQQAVTPSMQQA